MNYEEIFDIPSAKERFMGNFGLYTRFLFQFPDKSLFGELEEKLKAEDAKAAFETAHTMKGVTANLSLKKMQKPLSDVVEILRAGDLPGEQEFAALKSSYEDTLRTIRQLQADGRDLFAS